MKIYVVHNLKGEPVSKTLTSISIKQSQALMVAAVIGVMPGLTWVELEQLGFTAHAYIPEHLAPAITPVRPTVEQMIEAFSSGEQIAYPGICGRMSAWVNYPNEDGTLEQFCVNHVSPGMFIVTRRESTVNTVKRL